MEKILCNIYTVDAARKLKLNAIEISRPNIRMYKILRFQNLSKTKSRLINAPEVNQAIFTHVRFLCEITLISIN